MKKLNLLLIVFFIFILVQVSRANETIRTPQEVYLSGDNGTGESVRDAGDVNGDGYNDVIVGNQGYLTARGRAYIYFGGQTLDPVADIVLTGESIGIRFGCSVSTAGDVNGDGYDDVIVGARFSNNGDGKAYIFFGGLNMDTSADLTMTGGAILTRFFGASVSEAGDVNNDGYSDVIVGAYDYGHAFIFFGGPVLNNTADVIMSYGRSFGISVSNAGDVNSDGFQDVIVGDNYASVSSTVGKAYIFFGSLAMDNVADVTLSGEIPYGGFGISVSNAGDVNGDGFSDVLVGGIYPSAFIGRAYLFFGGSPMNNSIELRMGEGIYNHYFGFSLSSGDFNGDSYSDMFVSVLAYGVNIGRAEIYLGGPDVDNIPDVIKYGGMVNIPDYYAYSVSTAGDCDGDGYDDIVVGAPGYDFGMGGAFLYTSVIPVSSIRLNLTLFIEGFYDEGSSSQTRDTVSVYLRAQNSPFTIVDQGKASVAVGGYAVLNFNNAPSGNYYIELTHRNSLETWSSSVLTMLVGGTANYDFSNSQSQTFGNNSKLVDSTPVRYAVFSGDVNQDKTVDLTDIVNILNDANLFLSGYVVTDVTSDYIVDLSDLVLAFNNSSAFVSVIRP